MENNTPNQHTLNKWVERIVHDYWLHTQKQMEKDGVSYDEYSEAQQKRIICDCFLEPDFFRKKMLALGTERENPISSLKFDIIMEHYGTLVRKAIVLELEKQKAIIELEQMENDDTEK